MTGSSNESTPGRVRLASRVWIEPEELRYTFTRSSGPGGQSVNKVSSAAHLRVAVTAIRGLGPDARDRLRRLAGSRLTKDDEIVMRSQVHRSQHDNRRACLERLQSLVERAAIPPTVRRKKKPTRAMIERRLTEKRKRAEKKQRRRGADEH